MQGMGGEPRANLTSTMLVVAGLALAGCGTGRTTVLEAATQPIKATGITLQEAKSTVDCPADVIAQFRAKLSERLYQPGAFSKEGDVTLSYRVVQYNPGSQFQRWLTVGLGNTGEGSLTFEAVYLDGAGNPIGKIMSEGRIGSGFFGGSLDNAVDKAADEVADYTEKNFK